MGPSRRAGAGVKRGGADRTIAAVDDIKARRGEGDRWWHWRWLCSNPYPKYSTHDSPKILRMALFMCPSPSLVLSLHTVPLRLIPLTVVPSLHHIATLIYRYFLISRSWIDRAVLLLSSWSASCGICCSGSTHWTSYHDFFNVNMDSDSPRYGFHAHHHSLPHLLAAYIPLATCTFRFRPF